MGATRRGARSYRDLIAWQRAFVLADRCLDVADRLPAQHGALANQIRRSAVSVVSNIAEGNGRLTLPDYVRHLRIAHASLMELETQLLLARRRHRDGPGALDDVLQRAAETSLVLGGLIRSLQRFADEHPRATRGAGRQSSPTPPSA